MVRHSTRRAKAHRILLSFVAALFMLATSAREARADDRDVMLLVGIGLLAGGIVAGAPGVAILAVCDEGSDCYSTETTVAGWVLLAPGLPGILVGGILIGAAAGSSGRRVKNILDELPVQVALGPIAPRPNLSRVAAMPRPELAPSGAMLELSFSF